MPFSRLYLIMSLLFISSFAAAENQSNDSENITQPGSLETILVTARRQDNTLYSLVFSANKLDQDKLADISASHSHEIMSRFPSTWISRNNGQEQLTAIRSPVFTGAGSCADFLMMQDNIPLRPVGLCNVNQMFEADTELASTVELIPSSGDAWFGNGSVHGIINVLSPKLDGEQLASLEVGSHDYYKSLLKIGENERYSLSASLLTDGGFMKKSGVDQQKVLFKWQSQIEDWQVISSVSANNLNQETAGYINGTDAYKNYGLRRDNNDEIAFRDAYSLRYYSRFTQQQDSGQWQITPYLRQSAMKFRMHFLPGDPVEENAQQSAGLMLHYHFNEGAWQAGTGVDMEIANIELQQFQPDPTFSANFPAGDHYDYEVIAWRFSPFTQLNYQFNEATSLSTGLRFETVFYDYENQLDNGSACPAPVSPLACRYFRPEDQRKRFANFSPNIGLVHFFNDELQLFTQLSHGYRAPETSELFRLQQGQYQTDLDSVESESLELGLRFRNGKMAFSPALFYTRKDNVIFQDTLRQWVNDAKTVHYGLELAGQWQFSPSIKLESHYTIARHRYNNNPNLLGTSTELEGNDIDTAPRTMGKLSVTYQNNDKSRMTLQTEYLGRYYTDPENLHRYDGHTLLHYTWHYDITSSFAVNFKIHNLLDKRYAERADFSGFQGDRYFPGMNQSFYLRMDYRF